LVAAGAYCTWDGMNADRINVVLTVFENNDTFVYNNPDGTPGDELVM